MLQVPKPSPYKSPASALQAHQVVISLTSCILLIRSPSENEVQLTAGETKAALVMMRPSSCWRRPATHAIPCLSGVVWHRPLVCSAPGDTDPRQTCYLRHDIRAVILGTIHGVLGHLAFPATEAAYWLVLSFIFNVWLYIRRLLDVITGRIDWVRQGSCISVILKSAFR